MLKNIIAVFGQQLPREEKTGFRVSSFGKNLHLTRDVVRIKLAEQWEPCQKPDMGESSGDISCGHYYTLRFFRLIHILFP